MLGAATTIPGFGVHELICTILLIGNDILYSYLYTLFVYLVIQRFYLLFFHLNWKKSMLNSQWKNHLSLNQDANCVESLDFFLKNKATWGNAKKSRKFFLILYFIHASLICCGYIWESLETIESIAENGEIDDDFYEKQKSLSFLFEILMWVPPFIVTVLLWKATPSYYDYFFVRNEMKWFCLFYAIDLIGSLSIEVSPTEFIKEV